MEERAKLWSAIFSMYDLLECKRSNSEANYQRLLEDHPVILEILGFDRHESFEKKSTYTLPFDSDRNYTPEPDFIACDHRTGIVTVVDLKTPFVKKMTTSRSDGNRMKLSAEAEAYISQTTEYANSIRERPDARKIVCDAMDMDKITAYEILLLYGLDTEQPTTEVSELLAERKVPIKILGFDTLLSMLIERYASCRPDKDAREGWAIAMNIALPAEQPPEGGCILHFGEGNGAMATIRVTSEELMFDLVEECGRNHQITCPHPDTDFHTVYFEFASDKNGTYMAVALDGEEQELRTKKQVINVTPKFEMTVGADFNGKRGAKLWLGQLFVRNPTLSVVDKIKLTHYLKEVRNDPAKRKGLEFNEVAFVKRDLATGNLMQPQKELAPIYRDWSLSP